MSVEAVVTVTVSHTDPGLGHLPVRGVFAISAGAYPSSAGSPPGTLGLPVSFTGLVQVQGNPVGPIPSPNSVFVHGLSGYDYVFEDADQTVRIFDGGVELSGYEAIPAAVVADTISFTAVFPKA